MINKWPLSYLLEVKVSLEQWHAIIPPIHSKKLTEVTESSAEDVMATDDFKEYIAYLQRKPSEETRRKFEHDKAVKDPHRCIPPGCQMSGEPPTPRGPSSVKLYQIILTSLSDPGPFTSAEKVQEVYGLKAVPEVKTATRIIQGPGWKVPEDSEKLGEVDYVEVDVDALSRVGECADGEEICVWVRGSRRSAWITHSMGEPEQEDEGQESMKSKKESGEAWIC